MMQEATFSTCVKCSANIPQQRYVGGMATCDCGWFNVHQSIATKPAYFEMEKNTIKLLICSAFALVGLFAHFATWGSYGFAIPVVTLQKWTGTLSMAGYEELAKECLAIGKYSCAKDAYLGEYHSKGQLVGLARLASLQSRLGESTAALNTLDVYFKGGGKATQSALLYGKLLEGAGRTEDAVKFYDLSIETSGQFLPVTATSNLVRIYMKQGKFAKALGLIETFHDSAENASGYLNTERAQLEKHLQKQASRPGKGRRPAKALGTKRMV